MERNELRMALRTVPFLDAHAADPHGVLELRSRPTRRLLVWQPEAIDWIFRHDRELRHVPSRSLSPLLGQHSLLWLDGDRHVAYRRVLGPLLRGRQLQTYRPVVADAVHGALDAAPPGTVVSLSGWTRSIALRVIGRILLAHADDALLATFTAWIHRALGWRPRTLVYRYLAGGLPTSGDGLDQRLVAAARMSAGTDSLAGALLAEDSTLGPLADAELRDQIVSLLFAGHETTASAAASALYWLDRHDTVRQDVTGELRASGGDGFDAADSPLLHAVVRETLRLSPPAPVAGNRVLGEDAEVAGTRLAAGTVLTPSIYLAHHNARRFPDPYRFDPHRFLGAHLPPQQYLPFGGGTRHCLGSELAAMEIRMIVAAVLGRCRLRGLSSRPRRPQLRGHAMAPSPRLRMRVVA